MKKIYLLISILIICLSNSVIADQLEINEGWNLVSYGVVLELTESYQKETNNVYLFNPINKEYFKSTETSKARQIFATFDQDLYRTAIPVWYYSEENFKISNQYTNELNNAFSSNYENQKIKMIKGWNLITIIPELSGINNPNIFDSYGNCDIKKVYFFNPRTQQWMKLSNQDELEENMIGLGIAIDVLEDCEIKFEDEISTPPSILAN